MNVRRSVLAVLAWLAVVAVGSTVVWAVISRAGDGIAPTADSGVVATSSGTGPAAPASSTRPPSRPPSRSPTRSPSRSPHRSPGDPNSPAGPAAERRTWQGAGGLVIAECRGSAVALVSYSADPGFRVEVGDRGPEQLEVHFEGQGEEGRETELKAACVAGVPEFDVSSIDD